MIIHQFPDVGIWNLDLTGRHFVQGVIMDQSQHGPCPEIAGEIVQFGKVAFGCGFLLVNINLTGSSSTF